MVMGHGLGIIPIMVFLIRFVIPDAPKNMSVSEIGFNGKRYLAGCSAANSLGLFSSMLLIT